MWVDDGLGFLHAETVRDGLQTPHRPHGAPLGSRSCYDVRYERLRQDTHAKEHFVVVQGMITWGCSIGLYGEFSGEEATADWSVYSWVVG